MAPSIRQSPLSCRGHTRPVVDISFSRDTNNCLLLLTASKALQFAATLFLFTDGKAMLRRGDTGDWIGTLNRHKGAVWCCTLDECATKAATVVPIVALV
ncbi:unnamed protein product [Protopolystoma xenopodis]|uniref:Uncharacterized protein n=1 Tax=Protopolystoma xenopodis TaxID=117903 RepID=A0A3S5FFG4_9PLAT|nr:unnamed protein product [Protopolystoma xenopodis]